MQPNLHVMKNISLLAILLTCATSSYSQTVLKFCIESDNQCTCKTESSQFLIGKDGGTISFLIKNEKGLGTSHVVYRIYKLDEDGKENYNSDLDQKGIKGQWTCAWEDAVFLDPGTYVVKVYDIAGKESFIGSNTVKIFRDY